MVTEEEKQQAQSIGLEPEVVFNTLSDRRILAVQTEDTHETIMEISGYDLQINFNRDKLQNIADIESMLDGLKDLFRRVVMQDLLESLNDKQKEAVLTTEGPLLVLAGAGSGKTKVLTTRIAYLIEEENISPFHILAITFTNKAAKEMQERLFKIVGEIARNIQVSTFHSFGLKLLRENYELLGYERNFVIMDSDDSLTVIKRILKELDLDPKKYNPTAIKNKISGCKNELMSPKDYEIYATTEFEKIVLTVYEKYEQKLKANNSVDFDDLMVLPIKLFREHEDVLDHYQDRFRYILIDEYQDTNEAQYILAKMMGAKYRNVCVVGDENQSIYSFRGANYRNILNFEKDYKEAKTIKLEQNYRSTQNILNAANQVIKNNQNRKDKNLWSDKGAGDKITYYRSYDEKDEAHYVAHTIKKLIEEDCKTAQRREPSI